MPAMYNEIDPFAAAWLVQLEAQGHIAPGVIDERSIADLSPTDVAGPGQRHFFAGIGVWSYALRLAGVPDDASIWTGSCPCQPFSAAGKRGGTRDPRHLWPAWAALIRECRPPIIVGEQVASQDGLAWLDLVFADLERCGYAVGAADLCAAGVGAPHARQRLYFVAYAGEDGRELVRAIRLHGQGSLGHHADGRGARGSMADHASPRRQGRARRDGASARELPPQPARRGAARGLGDARRDGDLQHLGDLSGDEGEHGIGPSDSAHPSIAPGATRDLAHPDLRARDERVRGASQGDERGASPRSPGQRDAQEGALRTPWDPCDWIPCRTPDGTGIEWRPVEPGTFPLAHGAPNRVGRLRGYGNAIVAEVAATFLEAAFDAIEAS